MSKVNNDLVNFLVKVGFKREETGLKLISRNENREIFFHYNYFKYGSYSGFCQKLARAKMLDLFEFLLLNYKEDVCKKGI